jgi:hypothetical protein
VDRARTEGVVLDGLGGPLTGFTKADLEAALEVEMANHFDYDKHDPLRGIERIPGTVRYPVTRSFPSSIS